MSYLGTFPPITLLRFFHIFASHRRLFRLLGNILSLFPSSSSDGCLGRDQVFVAGNRLL